MGLHAAIIRLSPLIHEREQRYKPYIVGDPRMVTPPLKNPGYASERFVVMFVVDLYLTFSYFVSFVRVYCSDSLVRLMSMPRASIFCNSLLVGPCVTGYVLALLFVSVPVVI